MRPRNFLITVCSFLFLTTPSEAQEEKLTLEAALSRAFAGSPELRKTEARLESAQYTWRLETGLVSPEISYFREGMSREGNIPFEEQRIALTQTLESPLATRSRIRAARLDVEILEAEKEAFEKQLQAEVKSNYVEILYATRNMDLRKSQLDLAMELYNAVLTRQEAGMATGLDLLNAELQLAEARNDLDNTTRELHLARYNLFRSIGLPPEEQKYSITFSDTLFIRTGKIDQLYAMDKIEEQPQYLSARQELEKTILLEKSLRQDLLPSFYLSYYLQDYGTGWDQTGFEAGVQLPLWHGIEQKGKIRMVRAMQDHNNWNLEAIRLDMKREIEHAWHSYDEYRKMVERFQETIASSSQQLLELTLEAYRIGEIDLLNLLNAQQVYLTSRQRFLSALRQFYLQAVQLEKFLPDEIVY